MNVKRNSIKLSLTKFGLDLVDDDDGRIEFGVEMKKKVSFENMWGVNFRNIFLMEED